MNKERGDEDITHNEHSDENLLTCCLSSFLASFLTTAGSSTWMCSGNLFTTEEEDKEKKNSEECMYQSQMEQNVSSGKKDRCRSKHSLYKNLVFFVLYMYNIINTHVCSGHVHCDYVTWLKVTLWSFRLARGCGARLFLSLFCCAICFLACPSLCLQLCFTFSRLVCIRRALCCRYTDRSSYR